MANKITETISLRIQGTSFAATLSGTGTVDQVGSNYTEETQTIPTASAVLLDIGVDIVEGNLGYLIVRNLAAPPAAAGDPKNIIDIATDDAMVNKIASIDPSKGGFIPPPGGTVGLYAKAQLADTQIVFLAIEK
jgi:hypothetical protein